MNNKFEIGLNLIFLRRSKVKITKPLKWFTKVWFDKDEIIFLKKNKILQLI